MDSKVDAYIAKHEKWSTELTQLRDIFLSCGLEEGVKWGGPVYMVEGKNVTGMAAFKNHYGIWFFNGVFLKDSHKLLVQVQEKTKALRQIKFQKGDTMNLDHIREYVLESIDNEKAGLKMKPTRDTSFEMPELLQAALNGETNFQQAFAALSPGKQKEYAEYVTSAKQEKTKLTRLDKIRPMILEGVGLHDKYKNC